MTLSTAIGAVLLDLDGTLADSLPILYKAYQMFLHRYGHEGSPEEFERLNGPSMGEIVTYLIQRYSLPFTPSELGSEGYKLLVQAYASKIPLFPGSKEFLTRVAEKGISLSIVTSLPQPLAEAFLERHAIRHYFCELITPEPMERGKPDPAIYRRALKKLSLSSQAAVVFEDSRQGVEAAIAAQIPTVQICHRPDQPARGVVATVADWESGWGALLPLLRP